MRILILILLPTLLLAQAPIESEWASFNVYRYGQVNRLNLLQQPEGSKYAEWSIQNQFDSLLVLRKDSLCVLGFRPAGGYAMQWDRRIFVCPKQKLKRKDKSAGQEPQGVFAFNEFYAEECKLLILDSDRHPDTLLYTSTWNCSDPLCGSKHGHIQFRTEHWSHPQFGTLVTRSSIYGRPSQLSFYYASDPKWMRIIEALSKNMDWEFTPIQAGKMKQCLGFSPEL